MIPTFGKTGCRHTVCLAPKFSANGKMSGFATRSSSRADVPTVVAQRFNCHLLFYAICRTKGNNEPSQTTALARDFCVKFSPSGPKRKTRPFTAAVFVSKLCRKGSGWRGARLKALAFEFEPIT